MEEIWKDIKGYEGFYEISSFGRVRSLDREVPFKVGISHFKILIGKIKKPEDLRLGYKRVRLGREGKSNRFLVHRLVAQAFIPNPRKKEFVNHIDNNPANNNVFNLNWCTRVENLQHASKQGRLVHGENHKSCKLNFEKVMKTRELYALGHSLRSIGRKFEVSKETIKALTSGRTWKHI